MSEGREKTKRDKYIDQLGLVASLEEDLKRLEEEGFRLEPMPEGLVGATTKALGDAMDARYRRQNDEPRVCLSGLKRIWGAFRSLRPLRSHFQMVCL